MVLRTIHQVKGICDEMRL